MPHPLVRSSPEGQCFGKIETSFLFQVICEKSRHHLAPVVLCCGSPEIDRTELPAFTPRPSSMVPRTYNKKVLMSGIVALQQLVNLDRTIEVLLIPPTRDVQ